MGHGGGDDGLDRVSRGAGDSEPGTLRDAPGPVPGVRWRSGAPPPAPKFSPDESRDPAVYRRWARRVGLWQRRVHKWIPPNEQALMLYEAIEGEASRDLEFVSLDQVDHRDGVQFLLNLIKDGYDENPVLRKGHHLAAYEGIKRTQGETMRHYLNRYLRIESQLADVGIDVRHTMDAESRGHRLLHTSSLPPDVARAVITTAGHTYNFQRIKEAMLILYPGAYAPPLQGATYGPRAGQARTGSGNFRGNNKSQPRSAHVAEHVDDEANGTVTAEQENEQATVDEPEQQQQDEDEEPPVDEEAGSADDVADVVATLNDVLSVTSTRLKALTQARGFSKPRPGSSKGSGRGGAPKPKSPPSPQAIRLAARPNPALAAG